MAELDGPLTPRAIVFDLDGTLYDQSSVRQAMLLELVRRHIYGHFKVCARCARSLPIDGHREYLRTSDTGAAAPVDVADAQLDWPRVRPVSRTASPQS